MTGTTQNPEKPGPFLRLGNSLAIDFANTELSLDGVRVDRLVDARAFFTWLEEACIEGFEIPAATLAQKGYAAGVLKAVQAYRAFLREGFAALTEDRPLPPGLLAATNRCLAEDADRVRLVEAESGFALGHTARPQSPEALLAPIARSFACLLTEMEPRRLRRCRNPACTLFFYDSSKNGTRAWCSLDLCGNRLRMAASRQRRARPVH